MGNTKGPGNGSATQESGSVHMVEPILSEASRRCEDGGEEVEEDGAEHNLQI